MRTINKLKLFENKITRKLHIHIVYSDGEETIETKFAADFFTRWSERIAVLIMLYLLQLGWLFTEMDYVHCLTYKGGI